MLTEAGERIAAAAAQLPVAEVLDAIAATLVERDELVLQAPPGAGKTTLVPLSLLSASWLAGRNIVLLEPRRMAARAAARRMAQLLGEAVGETVGYRVRLDSCVSAATRIEVVTEGVLGRMLLQDPALSGVGLLIFDEFHERSLDADLGLALALQGRELFREPDEPLKVLVMSATLDATALCALLDDAPLLVSQGRQYPVALHYCGVYRSGDSQLDQIADLLLQRVLPEQQCRGLPQNGSAGPVVLVFLPGQREINQLRRMLHARLGSLGRPGTDAAVEVVALHGALGLEAQQRAIAPAQPGHCKWVLATNIAETSLTIPGVDTVIDSGLARMPRFDLKTGVTRLHTTRISRDASVQRMGRAGRLGPGQCYRLWSEQQQAQLEEHRTPELLQADLLPLALYLLCWGCDDPAQLRWLTAPPAAAFAQALATLAALQASKQASGGASCLTEHGEAMSRLPLHPRLAHMLLGGAAHGIAGLACDLAAILTERDPCSVQSADVAPRLSRLHAGEGSAEQRNWRRQVRRQAASLRRALKPLSAGRNVQLPALPDTAAPGVLLALAYPERVARRREPGGCVYQLANGRAAALADNDTLRNTEWLAVADTGGQSGQVQDRIFIAAELPVDQLLGGDDGSALAQLVQWREVAYWDDVAGRFIAERQARCGVLVLRREDAAEVSPQAKHQALLALVARRGLQLLPWSDQLRQWQARVMLLRTHWAGQGAAENPWPDVSDQALLERLPQWLGSALEPVNAIDDFQQIDLAALLSAMLPWPLPKQLCEQAPTHWRAPSGTELTIDYCQSPPFVAVKLQEMFGCQRGPVVAQGKVTVLVHMLSPARRPLQVTADLAGFWTGSYHQIKKEMKGRYPKHPWPDDPLNAEPTRFTRRRGR